MKPLAVAPLCQDARGVDNGACGSCGWDCVAIRYTLVLVWGQECFLCMGVLCVTTCTIADEDGRLLSVMLSADHKPCSNRS